MTPNSISEFVASVAAGTVTLSVGRSLALTTTTPSCTSTALATSCGSIISVSICRSATGTIAIPRRRSACSAMVDTGTVIAYAPMAARGTSLKSIDLPRIRVAFRHHFPEQHSSDDDHSNGWWRCCRPSSVGRRDSANRSLTDIAGLNIIRRGVTPSRITVDGPRIIVACWFPIPNTNCAVERGACLRHGGDGGVDRRRVGSTTAIAVAGRGFRVGIGEFPAWVVRIEAHLHVAGVTQQRVGGDIVVDGAGARRCGAVGWQHDLCAL